MQVSLRGSVKVDSHFHELRSVESLYYVPEGRLSVRQGRPSSQKGRVISSRAANTDEPDIAVFRFTLGIPGFDDADIPRILGWAAIAVLTLNHVLNDSPTDAAQVRAEGLGGVLAGLAIAVPTVHRRLQDALPGRGRKTTSTAEQGSKQAFHLESTLVDEQKQELAWASFALLKNVNIDGLLVHSGSKVLMGRGEFCKEARLEDNFAKQAESLFKLNKAADGTTYFAESPPLRDAALQKVLLPGVQSLFTAPLQNSKSGLSSQLIMWSKMPRALSQRDRLWAAAIAQKLADFIA